MSTFRSAMTAALNCSFATPTLTNKGDIMKAKFQALLIPDRGPMRETAYYATAVVAQTAGRSEARLLFKQTAATEIELVVCENRNALAGMGEIIRKDSQNN